MKIKEIKVKNYGPIDEFHTLCGDVQVIYGRNETGKTALVDAITTALFQKKSVFPGQDRFKKYEDITLRLEHSGKEYFFPGSVKFEQLVNLPHFHLAGLFIIRAGDLSLRKDRKWKDKVKEFLSGIPANIERIKEKIGEEVGLTPGGEWSDRQAMRRKSEIKEKEKRKNDLLQAIEKLKQMCQREKILKDKMKRRDLLKKKLENIRVLKSYRLHRRVKDAYLKWRRSKSLLLDYQRYLEEDLDLWLKKEQEKQSLFSRRESCKYELDALRKDLKIMDGERLSLEKQEKDLLNKRNAVIRLSIDKKARELILYQRDFSPRVLKLSFYTVLGTILFLSGIFLSLVGIFLGWGLIYTFSSLFLSAGGVYLLFLSYFLRKEKLNLERKKMDILEKGRKLWSECRDIDELVEKCEKLNLDISKVESKLGYIDQKRKEKLSFLEKKEEELRSFDKQLEVVENEIEEFRNKTGLSSLSQLEKKIRDKRKIELEIDSLQRVLIDSTGTDDFLLWEKEAEKEIPEPDIKEEDLTGEGKFEKELSQLNEEIQNLKEDIASFVHGELGRFQIKEVTDIWRELEQVENTLRSWYQDKEAALLAWSILDEVGQDIEKILLDTVADEKNGVSFYFSLITSGRYRKVRWEEDSIYVKQNNGESYPVEALSSGTQDQLFFSLRLGILKRGFPEGTFLLLDDAFLTSDSQRREQQVRVCQELAKQGWQIFYFTVDEHLRDLFCRMCHIKPLIL